MNNLYRWVINLMTGVLFAIMIRQGNYGGFPSEKRPASETKYGTVIYPGTLIILFLMELLISCLGNSCFSFDIMFSNICMCSISVVVFYALFLSFLPLLRKYISVKTIAILWILPNYLYFARYSVMALDKPVLSFSVGTASLQKVSLIWFTVASIVFAAYVIRHLLFRYKLLRGAKPVSDELVCLLWEKMQTEYEIKKTGIKMVTSDQTPTPLSIGVFWRTTVLVLPDTDYTEDELKLIFRHELIHIIRRDSQYKLYIAFCNAICWFNPFMWAAMKKSTEDLELSCDEYVVEDCSKEEKALYGKLILSTAGNDAGFSSCLSAGAGALKYRLDSIYKPKRKYSGGVIAGVILATMLLTTGCIAISYSHQTLADVFDKNVKELKEIEWVSYGEGNEHGSIYYCKDQNVLNNYLLNLDICCLTGWYHRSGYNGKSLTCQYKTDEGSVQVNIREHEIGYTPLYKEGRKERFVYYFDESVDWDYIMSLLTVDP